MDILLITLLIPTHEPPSVLRDPEEKRVIIDSSILNMML